MRNAQAVDAAERAARYCFLSALLCRQTFSLQERSDSGFDAEDFQCFIQANLAMQEALVVDMSQFSTGTYNLLARDVKMVVYIRSMLRESTRRHPSSLGAAIDTAWPDSNATNSRNYSNWKFLQPPYEWWVTSTVQAKEEEDMLPQILHYKSVGFCTDAATPQRWTL